MIGVLVNVLTVVVGSIIGLLFKKGIPEKITKTVMTGLGLCVIYIGVDGALEGSNPIIAVVCMALGGGIGALLNINKQINRLGDFIASRFKNGEGQSTVAEGFVSASLMFCVGAMAIVGSLNDGLTGDYSMLAAKSILDGLIALIMASTLGVGTLFSIIPVVLYQGSITLLAKFIAPVLSTELVSNLSYVGSALIFCIGINQVFGKKIKTGNMLPALLIPIIYELFTKLILPLF